MFRWTRRGLRAVALAAVLAVPLALTGCGSTSSPAESESESSTGTAGGTSGTAGGTGSESSDGPRRGGELVIGNQGEIFSLDLWTASAAHSDSIWAMQQLYEPLVVPGRDGKSFDPAVAESWSTSDDGLVTTFIIRKDLKFADGTPLTADDVKFSIDMGSESEVFAFLNKAITEVKVVDPTTVEIHTATRWGPLLADLTIYSNAIIPKDFGGKSREEFFTKPVGSGPFVVESWEMGGDLKLVRNEHYRTEGQPYLDSVVIRAVPDDNTRSLQLQGGQIQLMGAPPYSMVETLKNTPGVQVSVSSAEKVYYLLMNESEEHFADVNVRNAVAHALDRDAMVNTLLFGVGSVANSHLPPAGRFYDASTQVPAFDLAKAKEFMAKSGFPDGFTTEYVVGGTDQFGVTLAELVQQNLAQIGITVEISRIDPGAVSQARQNFEYGLQADWFLMDIADPDEILTYILDSENGGAYAYYTKYESKEMSDLVLSAAQESDDAKRAELYKQVQELAARELPQVPLFYAPTVWALSESVQGFEMLPTGNYRLEDVWLK